MRVALPLALLLLLPLAPAAVAEDRVPHCHVSMLSFSSCLGGRANGPACDTPSSTSYREEGVYNYYSGFVDARVVGWQRCHRLDEPYDDHEAYRAREYGVKSHTVVWYPGTTTVGVFVEWHASEYESESRSEESCGVLVRGVVGGVHDQWERHPCPLEMRPPNTGWETLP